MWYQFARLITVQIGLLFGCFCSIAVATIGYIAAMLLVKIEEEEVGDKGEVETIAKVFVVVCWWRRRPRRKDEAARGCGKEKSPDARPLRSRAVRVQDPFLSTRAWSRAAATSRR
jgi:hypothetical protein